MTHLATFEQTLFSLWLSPEGRAAVNMDDSAVATFLKSTTLPKAQQHWILQQPIARLRQYAHMVYGNVEETLSNIYPYTRQILAEAWPMWVEAYICQYPNPDYRLMITAESFSLFLGQQEPLISTWPFLSQLALYEWLEAELLSAEDEVLPSYRTWSDSIDWQQVPVWNPTAYLLQFHWDIAAIIEALKAQQPISIEPQETTMFLYRDVENHGCRFFKLTPLLAYWLALYQENSSWTLEQSLSQLASITNATLSDLKSQLIPLIPELHQAGILLGERSSG